MSTNWLLWVVIGLISILSGVMAILNPFTATIAAERIAAWMFVIVGLLQLVSVFRETGWKGRLWAGIVGVLSLLVGASLFANPLEGVISLTLLVALVFLATGITKIILSLQHRQQDYWWAVLLSGIVSVVLALMIFINLPFAAAGVLGVLLGIELLSNGFSLVALGLMRKRIGKSASMAPKLH